MIWVVFFPPTRKVGILTGFFSFVFLGMYKKRRVILC